jgi:hypothetical protein
MAVCLSCFSGLSRVRADERGLRTDLAQVSIADALSSTVIVRVRIADVFGDRLLVEDGTGRVLVEIVPGTAKPATLEAGQDVEVEGRLRGRTIEARRIAVISPEAAATPGAAAPRQADGTDASVPPHPDPGAARREATDALLAQLSRPADVGTIRSALEAIGLSASGPPVRRNKHTEITARDAAGKTWTASLDRFGRLEEIELDDYDDDAAPSRPRFDVDEVVRIVARAGYTPRAGVERRSEHFEALALNPQGDIVEIHVDFAGVIYKVVWIR